MYDANIEAFDGEVAKESGGRTKSICRTRLLSALDLASLTIESSRGLSSLVGCRQVLLED